MKIGFLCSEYPLICTEHGGIGSMTRTIARELVRHGHKAVVYSFSDKDAVIDDEGVEVFTVCRAKSILKAIVKMRKCIDDGLQSGKIDVIESPECEAHYLPGGKGSIVRMNGSHHFWARTLPCKKKPIRLMLEQIGVRSAYGLCAVSSYTAEVTRSAMHLGKKTIEILYNPVNAEQFVPRPETVVRGRIFFAGSVVRKKGIMELCLSMQQVLKKHRDAELIVAGRDCPDLDGATSFRRVIEDMLDAETKKHVKFLGHVHNSEVRDLMASAHVCVFPSYMETQGIVIAEAMACGRPVLVTNAGPGPEVLGTDGECGLLVDPKSPEDIAGKINIILSDEERADEMGRKGRQRSENVFSVAVCLKKNLDFYRKCAIRILD